MVDDFRCSVASQDLAESIVGTAPTESEWLLVEDPGPWPAKATGHLSHLVGPGRAQLIRRHGGGPRSGIRVFRAALGDSPVVTTALVGSLDEIEGAAFTSYDGPLWLVCTNGRRDVCCAERGRPVAAALAARWPEATWETTHLGGHRFAATLLALPSGVTLGRVDPAAAVEACAALEDGRLSLPVTRGVAGRPAAAQAAELHVRATYGWPGLSDVRLVGVDGDRVSLLTPDGPMTVSVVAEPGEPTRQSCADLKVKAAPRWRFPEVVAG